MSDTAAWLAKLAEQENWSAIDALREWDSLTIQIKWMRKAINEIDDYFEYRYESERDKSYVHNVLAELTAVLMEDGINE